MKEITMPKLSDTMSEGAVVAWHRAVGERVERGDVIAEVETDKATMELEAFSSGVLLEIRVGAGTTVPVGTVIGLIGEAAEKPAALAEHREAAVEPAPAAPPRPQPSAGAQAEHTAADAISAAPVVRRRALELGIDLATVIGSGPGGRILLEDLAPRGGEAATAVPPPAPSAAEELSPAAISRPEGEPLSKMRQAIAFTVTESWRTIPQFSLSIDVRMAAAEQFRHTQKAQSAAASLTALLVKASAMALQRFPLLNASLHDGRMVVHPQIHIGVVVRRDDGLLVPVLRDCAGLTFTETAQRTAQLVARARQGQLSNTELTGGTFAISNLGMYGVDSFVALILPPMAAVLAVGALRDGVVAVDGRPAVAKLLTLTLSADHRIVDGAYAAEFLRSVKLLLEAPESLGV